jgi:hypothetical protein
MKRSKHTLSHYRMVTGNMGDLMPISCVPTLPGDTFEANTDVLIRVSPLNTPVMHPVTVRVHHWFVPNRIIWPQWEDFITGGPDGNNTDTIPTTTYNGSKESAYHYLGCPAINGMEVSQLPLLAFAKIYNQRYRDQDLVPEWDPAVTTTIPKIAWEKDYASSARPWTQKGPEVGIPIGETAPIKFADGAVAGQITSASGLTLDSSLGQVAVGAAGGSPGAELLADLANASSVNVNDFRAAFAVQRYQEARARYGSRFTEYLRYCGVTPSDARLQEPEYLGGGTTRLNFSEVLQTANDPEPGTGGRANIGVGDMYGHGIAGTSTRKYRKFFEEHGYVITLLSVRPKALYTNALPKEWLKRTKEDYFQKELANLGQQEVFAQELHGGSVPDTVFGYQDRYHEYRSHPSQVSGDFTDVLNPYHMGRDLAPDPVLNQSFVECDPTDRIFQVGKDTAQTLWVMANNHIVARRAVPKRANPRII